MNIKETVDILQNMKADCVPKSAETQRAKNNALDTAIRSLEAWESMKDELEEFLENLRELHEWGRVFGVEQAVDIVNKYLQEVESEKNT